MHTKRATPDKLPSPRRGRACACPNLVAQASGLPSFASNDSERKQALSAISDMIARAEKAQAGFAAGTAPHTLQTNRIHALRVAQTLVLRDDGDLPCTDEDLKRTQAPLASLISKSAKAQGKLQAGSWQHRMLQRNLTALRLAKELLDAACLKQGGAGRFM